MMPVLDCPKILMPMAYFTHLSRRPGETLLNYVTDHDEKLRKIEEHDIQIPSEIQGWLLPKKANITKEQRQMIITQAPKLEKLKVQEALYLILGQDWKSAVSHDQHRRAGSGRLFRRGAYAALDDDDAPEELYEYDEEGYFEYDDISEYAANDDGWFDDSFDAQAAYYEDSEHGQPLSDENFDTDQYDDAFAAYLDARRRFQDLKLSRGFYPVVALADQGALPAAASSQQPVGKGKGFGGGKSNGKPKGRGKGSSVVKYPKIPMKNADPRGRAAAAAMQCLRCGAYGHQAAQCPKPQKHSAPPSQSPSPKKQHTTESMAVTQLPNEDGHVIFENVNGQPRVDCTMLDPGASAFLMGSGPFYRYVDHLRELGYPVDGIEMQRTNRTFHFGGDHSTVSHWIAKVPMFINSAFGLAQAFIIKGETPVLMGRPSWRSSASEDNDV